MERDRLLSRGNILLILLAVAGFMVYLLLNDVVFPSSAIDLKVSREEVFRIADDFFEDYGVNTLGYKRVIVLGADDNANAYLSKQLGIEGANRLVREGEVPIWRWELRYFKPLQKKEYNLYITPDGRLVKFSMLLPEDEKGANLTIDEAEEIALGFLKSVFPIDEGWIAVERSSTKHDARTDHVFVWENKAKTYGEEGRLRVSVEVAGNKVSKFFWYLKVPEKFLRDYQTQMSYGSFLALISALLTVILVVVGVVIFLRSFRAGIIPTRYPLIVAIIVAVALILAYTNDIPRMLMEYDTTSSMVSFIFTQIFRTVMVAIFIGIGVMIAVSIGDLYGRKYLPGRFSTIDTFRKGRVFTRELALSSLRGLCVAFIFIGGQVLFYLLMVKKFGVWFPAENEYSDVYGTIFPFIAPLTISIVAGVMEEYVFRLFSVVLLKRVFRYLVIGALISSAIWALAHSTYAVYPVYIRGIELTIFGMLMFYFFFRYNLMTVIIAHYTIDAFYIGYPLLKANSTYFFVSGIIVMSLALLPLISLAFIRRRAEIIDIPTPTLTLDGLGRWVSAFIRGDSPLDERRRMLTTIIQSTFEKDVQNIDELAGRLITILNIIWNVKAQPTLKRDNEIAMVAKSDENTMKEIDDVISGLRVGSFTVQTDLTEKLEIRVVC